MSTLFAFVLLLGVLIFVHELGHFLVAKACGVRVLKFSLGFGPPIALGPFRLQWKHGHTEYVVAWLPLGGFVKMLGESLDEEEGQEDAEARAHPEESFNEKPVWQKLAIVFAGPAMNLLLPVVVFVGTLFVGMPRADVVIGMIERGSPAAASSLQPGDRIRSVGGAPVRWWGDIAEVLRARPGQQLEIAYERGGESGEVSLRLAERAGFDEFGTVTTVGFSGLGHRRLRSLVGVPDASSPAYRAGMRSGDRVVAVDETPVEDWQSFAAAVAAASPQALLAIDVERGPEDAPERVGIEVVAAGDPAGLGVVPANVFISEVEAGSAADRAGLEKGDLILSVDGDEVGSFESFAERVRTSGGASLALVFARDGGTREVALQPELVETDVGLGIDEPRYRIGIRGALATVTGVVVTDRERNPLISIPRAVGMTVDVTGTFLRGLGKLITGEVSRRNLAGPIGIAEIAGNAFEKGWETYLSIMVLISINLAILNLLPIPILDGGQALIFAIEGIQRAPLSQRTRGIFQQIGVTVLIMLMGLAFWNDISRHWSKVVGWLSGGSGL